MRVRVRNLESERINFVLEDVDLACVELYLSSTSDKAID